MLSLLLGLNGHLSQRSARTMNANMRCQTLHPRFSRWPQPKRSASIAHVQASTACFVFFFPVMSCVLHSSGALFQLSLVLLWGRTLVGMQDAPTHQVPTELWKKRHVLFYAGKDWKYMKSSAARSGCQRPFLKSGSRPEPRSLSISNATAASLSVTRARVAFAG